MNKLLSAALLLSLAGPAAATTNTCTHWSGFATLGVTNMTVLGNRSRVEFALEGSLIYRPLIRLEDTHWVGLQLYDASSTANGESSADLVYGVPFAVKLDNTSGQLLDMVYNAPLKFEDQQKLRGVYTGLHIDGAPAGSNPADYRLEDDDDMGMFEVRYEVDDNRTLKTKQRYTELTRSDLASAMLEISEVVIHGDETRFEADRCWHTSADGSSDIEVLSRDNSLNIRVEQEMSLRRRDDPLPADARLLTLPENPEEWIQMAASEVYPPATRQPEETAEKFFAGLAGLDITDSDAVLQYLFDNEKYLLLIKANLDNGTYDLEFEKRLMLMIGKTDSPNAHALLTEIFIDDDMSDQARFRSLMALKYAKNPIDERLVEEIFSHSSATASRQLGHSAMMVLGIVARNQIDQAFGRELSQRLALELGSASNTHQAAALLTALGNAGDDNNQQVLQSYLGHDEPLLRQRSAAALGQMPNAQAAENLSRLLAIESNPAVQEAALTSLSSNNPEGNQLAQVYEYARDAEQHNVRNAAITALSSQMETNPGVEAQLRQLLKTEKNRANLHKILSAVY